MRYNRVAVARMWPERDMESLKGTSLLLRKEKKYRQTLTNRFMIKIRKNKIAWADPSPDSSFMIKLLQNTREGELKQFITIVGNKQGVCLNKVVIETPEEAKKEKS